MSCKVCHYPLSEHTPYEFEICLGYMNKGIERIQYGLSHATTEGDKIISRAIEDAQMVLRD